MTRTLKEPQGGTAETCAGAQQGQPSVMDKHPRDYRHQTSTETRRCSEKQCSELIRLPCFLCGWPWNCTDALNPNYPPGFENPRIRGSLNREIWALVQMSACKDLNEWKIEEQWPQLCPQASNVGHSGYSSRLFKNKKKTIFNFTFTYSFLKAFPLCRLEFLTYIIFHLPEELLLAFLAVKSTINEFPHFFVYLREKVFHFHFWRIISLDIEF